MFINKYWMAVWVVMVVMLAGCGGNGGGNSGEGEIQSASILYHFDETSGAVAKNASADYLDGNIFGATRVSGISGNALMFGDDGDRVQIGVLNFGEINFENNSLTIEADLKFDQIDITKTYHFFGDGIYGLKSFRILFQNGNFKFQIYDSGGAWIDVVISNYSFQTNKWYEIAVTYNGDEGVISIDGVENARTSFISTLPTVHNDLYLGGLDSFDIANSGIHSFPGVIDEFYFK